MSEVSQNTRITGPDLAEYLKNQNAKIKSEINCVLIGTIVAFDVDTQTASISVNYSKKIIGGLPIGDNRVADRLVNYPLLINCPVIILTGGAGYMTFPIVAGDSCLVLFCDREIDSWMESGASNPPNIQRMHDINDGIALVGIRPYTNPIENYNVLGPTIQMGTGLVSVQADGVVIQAKMVTLRTALDMLLTALLGWVDNVGNIPNPATVIALEAAQVAIDAVLKENV